MDKEHLLEDIRRQLRASRRIAQEVLDSLDSLDKYMEAVAEDLDRIVTGQLSEREERYCDRRQTGVTCRSCRTPSDCAQGVSDTDKPNALNGGDIDPGILDPNKTTLHGVTLAELDRIGASQAEALISYRRTLRELLGMEPVDEMADTVRSTSECNTASSVCVAREAMSNIARDRLACVASKIDRTMKANDERATNEATLLRKHARPTAAEAKSGAEPERPEIRTTCDAASGSCFKEGEPYPTVPTSGAPRTIGESLHFILAHSQDLAHRRNGE